MAIIDAHQHFWKYEPLKHEWIDNSMSSIRRDFMPTDLKKVYTEHKIDGCVAVQADQTLQETDFLIELAKTNDFIKGIVGWVDLQDQNVDQVLEQYSKQQIIKGFRHVVQAEPDHNFLLRSPFLKGISLLEKYDYTYDILVFPHQLGAVLEFVRLFPNQKFVIDHIAKPHIKDGFYDGWAILMKEIGKFENVYCKLSGMITEAHFTSWKPDQIHPYMHLVFEIFGADRIMFGSDWPVCLVAGNYAKVKELITNFIAETSTAEQNAVMGDTAIQFYSLTNKK